MNDSDACTRNYAHPWIRVTKRRSWPTTQFISFIKLFRTVSCTPRCGPFPVKGVSHVRFSFTGARSWKCKTACHAIRTKWERLSILGINTIMFSERGRELCSFIPAWMKTVRINPSPPILRHWTVSRRGCSRSQFTRSSPRRSVSSTCPGTW